MTRLTRPAGPATTRRALALAVAGTVGLAGLAAWGATASAAGHHAAAPVASVLGTVAVGTGPDGVAVDPTRHEAFVANALATPSAQFPTPTAGSITVLSTATRSKITTWSLTEPVLDVAVDPAADLVFAALGDRSHTANHPGATIAVLNEQTGAVRTEIAVGFLAAHLAIDTTHATLLATADGDVSVATIDLRSPTFASHTVQLPDDGYFRSLAIAVDPTTQTEYIVNARTPGAVLHGAEGSGGSAMSATSTAGSLPVGIAADPVTGSQWVTFPAAGSVGQIRGNKLVGSVTTGSYPEGVTVDPSTGTVFVADPDDDTVTLVREADRSVLGRIAIGRDGPDAMAVDSSNHVLVVADSLAGSATFVAIPGSAAPAAPTTTAPRTAAPTTTTTATRPTTTRSASATGAATAVATGTTPGPSTSGPSTSGASTSEVSTSEVGTSAPATPASTTPPITPSTPGTPPPTFAAVASPTPSSRSGS